MYRFLMHKDTIVALCKNNKTMDVFEEKLLPFGISKDDKQYDLTNWLDSRQIPEGRTNINKIKSILAKKDIDIKNLYHYNYGLSLTDNYWFYELKGTYITIMSKLKLKIFEKELPKYNDICLFNNQKSEGFIQNVLLNKDININILYSPDITTNGNTQKYWVSRNEKMYLVKQNDTVHHYVAEKEILASFIAYLINECRIESKKKAIPCVAYQFEKGKNEYLNCAFSECFTTTHDDLVTYSALTIDESKKNRYYKFKDFLENNKEKILSLKEYLEFIIVLDYIIENNREENDICFFCNSEFNKVLRPAPVFGNCNSFDYMDKDFTRANRQLYSSPHINIFNMDERQQCKYIAENIDWFMPELLYRKIELFLDYLANQDMSDLSKQQRDNIADWVKYKLVMLADLRRKIAIANEGEEEQEDEYEYQHEEYISYDDDDDDEY